MERKKVLVIAPYAGLKELVSSIAGEFANYEIQAVQGNLENALPYVKRAELEGVSIILSRGGTAKQLAKHTSIPVLNIPVSGYDVLRSISLAKTFYGKRAVVGFESITHGYQAVNTLLDTDMEIVTINEEDELPAVLDYMKSKGVRLIIGDVVTVDYAKKKNFVGVLVTSGEESVRDALEQVGFLESHIGYYKKRAELLEQALNREPNRETLIFSDQGDLLFQTASLDETLANALKSRMADPGFLARFPDYLPDSKGQVFAVTAQTWHQNGTTATIFTAQEIQTRYQGIRIRPLSEFGTLSYNLFMNNDPDSMNAISLAESLSKTNRSVLIQGEPGVGKDWFGILMHLNTAGMESGLMILDCSLLTKEDIDHLFVHYALPDSHKRTPVLLNHLDMLSKHGQAELLSYSSRFEQFRFVATSRKSITAMGEEGSFLKELISAFEFSAIYLPSVREHQENIENLCSIAISSANESLGKQVVALENDAMELCKNYRWPGNLKQICSVMEDAVRVTEASFISKSTVQSFISEDKQTKDTVIYISKNKTLDQFEKEIILSVLQDEDMNQSRAADRLGIGRSTMWRKLNQI
ncbi:MAG: sigma 54-interacting transcriptional regulator [Clostridiales bacterium]|nr:sigma 54-interacting transcriptional regulator [Clostridiales bacterium]